MKKPKISNLKPNNQETKKIILARKNTSSTKITINIDNDLLVKVKNISNETDIPYQRLINKLLRENLVEASSLNKRLNNLEKEIQKVKKKLAA